MKRIIQFFRAYSQTVENNLLPHGMSQLEGLEEKAKVHARKLGHDGGSGDSLLFSNPAIAWPSVVIKPVSRQPLRISAWLPGLDDTLCRGQFIVVGRRVLDQDFLSARRLGRRLRVEVEESGPCSFAPVPDLLAASPFGICGQGPSSKRVAG